MSIDTAGRQTTTLDLALTGGAFFHPVADNTRLEPPPTALLEVTEGRHDSA